MNDANPTAQGDTPGADAGDTVTRKFLVVVDNSSELKAALRFACRRALHTNGAIGLFHAVPQAEFHHFAAIGTLMEREARSAGEQLLQDVAGEVHRLTGTFPALYIREGDTTEQLIKVLAEDTTISILVLGAGTGTEGPGPLVTALSGQLAGKIRIPVTIVPGDLDEARIDSLT